MTTTTTTIADAATASPAPLRPADPVPAVFSHADRRFNFAACSIDAIGWPLGVAFFSPATILPLFLRHLGANDVLVGALGALMNLLTFLPGLFVVGYVGRLVRARNYLFVVALIERFALLPLVWLTLAWGQTHPSWLIAALFVCIAAHTLAMGLNQPAYWVVVGKTIPPRWRGRLFGFAGGLAGVLGIGTEWLLREKVLGGPNGGFPDGFSRGFLIGFLLLTLSVLPLGLVREPPAAAPAAPAPNPAEPGRGQLLQNGLAVWHANRGFRHFLFAQVFFMLAALATPFFVLHAQQNLFANAGNVAGYTATLIFAAAFGNLVWGALADRLGNKVVLIAASVFATLAGALALVAPSPLVFFGVFAATALATAGVGLAGNNIVLEYAGDEPASIALYTVFYNSVTALPRAAAPLIGGLIAHNAGYRPLFFVSLALAAVSLALTLRVREPRHADSSVAEGVPA